MIDRGWLSRLAGRINFRRAQIAVAIIAIAASAIYLWRFGLEYRNQAAQFPEEHFDWVIASYALYAVSLGLTAVGWTGAVRAFGSDARPVRLLGMALVSQIGKYAPGNVAHHVGRIALAVSEGISLDIAARSTVLELISAVGAGIVVGACAILASPSFSIALIRAHIPASRPDGASPVFILLVLGIGAVGLLLAYWAIPRVRTWTRFAGRPAATTFLAHCGSLAIAGTSFYALARAILGEDLSLIDSVAAFTVAWLAGFLTPGMPAGLGVREAVLVFALSTACGPASLPIALGHRLITALADASMAVVGILALRFKSRVHSTGTA